MKHFDLSEQRLDSLFGPWVVAVSVLLGILLCWYSQILLVRVVEIAEIVGALEYSTTV
jgi:hypothetical protein